MKLNEGKRRLHISDAGDTATAEDEAGLADLDVTTSVLEEKASLTGPGC